MKIYVSIFCLLFVGMSITYCMEREVPKQLCDLDWKKDIRELKKKRVKLSKEKYQEELDFILEYAADRYERNKVNGKLSTEERERVKKRLLRRALKG